ncbi:MAG: SCO family protein [Balneolaceae bacterium]
MLPAPKNSCRNPNRPPRLHARIWLPIFALFLFIASCGEERLDDYNDLSVELTNQYGEAVTFPDDLKGKPVLMGFIYTHCPDICSFITANLHSVWEELDETDEAHFVLVTFDPERDRPEILHNYAEAFDMNRSPFTFLTGDPDQVEALMKRLGVRSQVSYTTETEEGEELYFLNHTDKILLIDENGRLVMDYGGSMTPTGIFTTDLNELL